MTPKALSRKKLCGICNKEFKGIKYCSNKCAYKAIKLNTKTKKVMKKPIYNSETQQHEIDGVNFNGHFVEWRFEYIPKTYLKESELSGNEYRKGGTVKIWLNDDCVYSEFCRTENMALTLITKHLHELKCHFEVFGIHLDKWKEEVVGKKVYHAGVPSIVERYCGDGEIILRTESGRPYEIYGSKIGRIKEEPDYDDEWYDKDRVHITDSRIWWWRK